MNDILFNKLFKAGWVEKLVIDDNTKEGKVFWTGEGKAVLEIFRKFQSYGLTREECMNLYGFASQPNQNNPSSHPRF